MPLIIGALLFCLTLSANPEQRSVAAISPVDRLVPPVVGPLDATFTHDGRIVIQSDGITSHQRSLSLWSSQERKWLLSKAVGLETPAQKGRWINCARTTYIRSSNSIVVCGSPGHLLVLDGDTFEVKREIGLDKWTNTYDFVASEDGERVYVVGLTRGKGVSLTQYAFSTSTLVRQSILPELDDCYPISLALALNGASVDLAIYGSVGGGSYGVIAVCQDHDTLSCRSIRSKNGVGQLEFSTSGNALFVSSSFADRSLGSRHDCIRRLSVATLQVNQHAYCTEYGAHYALAIIQNRFVLGYSGYATYNWVTETTKNLTESVSIWDAASGRLLAVAKCPSTLGSPQTAVKIIPERSGKMQFLVFNTFGADIFLFDFSLLNVD
jgi:hypothetical protein